jgi:hypothetical protein
MRPCRRLVAILALAIVSSALAAEDEEEARSPALDARLAAVAKALTTALDREPPLAHGDVRSWGPGDLDGDRSPELVVSWSRGSVGGGVAIVRGSKDGPEVLAIEDLEEPVIQVRLVPLAGDRTRHLLVRTGATDRTGIQHRRTLVMAYRPAGRPRPRPEAGPTGPPAAFGRLPDPARRRKSPIATAGSGDDAPARGRLVSLWQHRDLDEIERNPDLSRPRQASLSDVTFEEGLAGRPGRLTVSISRFRAPKGKGGEAAVPVSERVVRLLYDRETGRLVEKTVSGSGPEGPAGGLRPPSGSGPEGPAGGFRPPSGRADPDSGTPDAGAGDPPEAATGDGPDAPTAAGHEEVFRVSPGEAGHGGHRTPAGREPAAAASARPAEPADEPNALDAVK